MKVIECRSVAHVDNKNITFMRIDPENLQDTLSQIMGSLMNLSWLSRFDEDYLKNSFKKRAEETIADIKKKFEDCSDDNVTKEAGEYVVSELARESLVRHMSYLHIPLAELLGMKISGNPGFDFHSQNNTTNTVIFGEAKYNSRQSAYATAVSQVSKFIEDCKDVKQLAELRDFCSSEALTRANDGFKGFAIAFSAKSTASTSLIDSVIKHQEFIKLLPFEEIVIVAVNI